MGNWKNRRFFSRQRRNYTSYYDDPPPSPPPSPPKPGLDDGVPLWEKNFCFYIGSMPWRKVVNAKKFMYCHSDVVNWDDSAGKKAFQNAKSRYWAEINGLPSEVSLPDRGMYIDEINWNPDIDPELIKDLDLSFFAPADEEGDKVVGRKSKKTRKLVSYHPEGYNRNPTSSHSEGCKSNAAVVDNPWKCDNNVQTVATLKDQLQGWNQWNNDMNNSVNLKADDNPWERGSPPGVEAVKGDSWGDGSNKGVEAVRGDSWGDGSNKLWGWNQCEDHVDRSDDWKNNGDRWESSWQSTCHAEEKGWGNSRNSSWGYNQQEPRKLSNGYNGWQNSRSFNQGGGTPKDREWRDNGGQRWGWKQRGNYHQDQNNLESRRSNNAWGVRKKGHWEKEGSGHRYTTSYRSAQFAGDNYRTSNGWSRGKTKKRVNFAIE